MEPPQEKIVIVNPDESISLGTRLVSQRQRLITSYEPTITYLQGRINTFNNISRHHSQRIRDNLERINRAELALQNPNISPAQMMRQNSAIMEFENNIYDANQGNIQALSSVTDFSNRLNSIQSFIDQAPDQY